VEGQKRDPDRLALAPQTKLIENMLILPKQVQAAMAVT
jgi:hypothetical protein